MKIEKLYTVSRFVLLLDWMTTKEFCKVSGTPLPTTEGGASAFLAIDAIMFRLVKDYAKFLKQPLKKEMFVNELEIPLEMYYRPDEGAQKYPQECYLTDRETFNRAEKKVIFEGITILDGDILELPNGAFNPYLEITGITLNDLAEATNGELNLKNTKL